MPLPGSRPRSPTPPPGTGRTCRSASAPGTRRSSIPASRSGPGPRGPCCDDVVHDGVDVVSVDPAPVAEMRRDPVPPVRRGAADVREDHPVAAAREQHRLDARRRTPRPARPAVDGDHSRQWRVVAACRRGDPVSIRRLVRSHGRVPSRAMEAPLPRRAARVLSRRPPPSTVITSGARPAFGPRRLTMPPATARLVQSASAVARARRRTSRAGRSADRMGTRRAARGHGPTRSRRRSSRRARSARAATRPSSPSGPLRPSGRSGGQGPGSRATAGPRPSAGPTNTVALISSVAVRDVDAGDGEPAAIRRPAGEPAQLARARTGRGSRRRVSRASRPDGPAGMKVGVGLAIRRERDRRAVGVPRDPLDAPVALGQLARRRAARGIDDEQVRPAVDEALLVVAPVDPADDARQRRLAGRGRGSHDEPWRVDGRGEGEAATVG